MVELAEKQDYGGADPYRGYVTALLRQWWLILTIGLLAALVAFVVNSMMTPIYETSAGVVIAKSKVEVSFEERVQTLSESDLALLRGSYYQAEEDRRRTFAGMVKNGAIAVQVIEELGDTLSPKEQVPALLLEMIRGVVGEQGDLIQIVAQTNDPAKAAALANAWARYYEQYVNQVYSGLLPSSYTSVQREVGIRRAEYETAQKAVTDFIAEEDRTAELDSSIQEKETIIAAYQTAIADNRLLAFNKGQEAKRQVVSEMIDAEIASRIAALQRDRAVRKQLFDSYVDAELRSTLAVFEQQVQEKMDDLSQAYSRKDKLDQLLRDARALQAQVAESGDSESNHLALALLKAEAFASSVELPAELQVQFQAGTGDPQLPDVNALISALEQAHEQVEAEIQAQSEALLGGQGYAFLDQLTAANLAISAPYSSTVTAPGTAAAADATSDSLADYIDQRYADLFELGGMARTAETIIGDTALFQAFEALYPGLFEPDALMELSQPTSPAASQQDGQLAQTGGTEASPELGAESGSLAQRVVELQGEVRTLRAEKERIDGRLRELETTRDLAWETYTTMARKEEELAIAVGAGGSEVTFATPAVVPAVPIGPNRFKNTLLAGAAGLMAGVFLVLVLEYLRPGYDLGRALRARRG